MFQPYSAQPGPHPDLLRLGNGALWLIHLSLFASLLWLSKHQSWDPAASGAKKSPGADPPVCQLGLALKPVPPPRRITDPKPPPDTDCPLPSSDDVFGQDANPWGDAIPFSMAGMSTPKLISGAKIEYTPEALAARVQGLMIAKCTITCRGAVRNCRIIKSLPHMEEAVLSALQSRRYTPVTYQGRAISVSYIFNIKLSPP